MVLGAAATASADGRTDYLIRLLKTSSTFRVRAQAALSLGRIEGEREVVKALAGALDDRHPAVRTAAASSLGRLSDPSVLDDLKAARNDRQASVRRAVGRAIRKLSRIARTQPRRRRETPSQQSPATGGRYYVGVGTPGSKADIGRSALREAQQYIEGQLRSMDGVVLAPGNESRTQVQRTLKRRNLSGYYVDSSVVRVEESSEGTRVVVSVILNTYPGRDMRAMLQGAATVPGGKGPRAREQALQGAFRGALRRLPQALAQSAARDRN
jgi:hypothetical protein